MKLILFLIITYLLLLITSVYPQNTDKHPNMLNINQSSYEAFMSTPDAYRMFEVPAKIHKGFFDTAGSSADTLSRRISSGSNSILSVVSFWYQFSILTDDTLQISHSSSFGSSNITIILPNIPYTSRKLDINSITNFYYKVYGTGTPNTYWSLYGL